MSKEIRSYETIIVADLSNGEEAAVALVDKFKALIEANGEIESVDTWGKRRLAYEIDDKNEGYYVLINFKSDIDFPAELDRVYKITEGVMRTIIIKK